MYLSPYSLPSLEDFTSTAQESSKALAEGKMIRGFNWQLGCDDQWFAGMMVSVCTKKDTCTVYIDRCTVDRCTILYVPFVYMCIYTLYKYIYIYAQMYTCWDDRYGYGSSFIERYLYPTYCYLASQISPLVDGFPVKHGTF